MWVWCSVLLLILILFNGVFFFQAWAMTHYVPDAKRTARPERLSFWRKAALVLTGDGLPRPENMELPSDFALQYTTETLSLNKGEFIELWYIPSPKQTARTTALLFPGYGGCKANLLEVAVFFHKQNYDLILADFRGAGGSSGSDTTLGVRESRDIATVFAHAKKKWPQNRIILYGASLGAAAVLRAVAKESVTPAAVILESPFDSLLQTVRHRVRAMGLPPSPGAELLVFWGGFPLGVNGFENVPATFAQSVRCPTLLLHGDEDTRVTEADARRILTALPEPKQFAVLHGIGHGGFAGGADAGRWQFAVEKFLRDVKPQR